MPNAEEPAGFAAVWAASRAGAGRLRRGVGGEPGGRATQAAERGARAAAPKDPEQAARTAARRQDRVTSGLAELDVWLRDQVADRHRGGVGRRLPPLRRDGRPDGRRAGARRRGHPAPAAPGHLVGVRLARPPPRRAGPAAAARRRAPAARRAARTARRDRPAAGRLHRLRPTTCSGRRRFATSGTSSARRSPTPETSSRAAPGCGPPRRTGRASSSPSAPAASSRTGPWSGAPAIPADVHFYPGQPALRCLVGRQHGDVVALPGVTPSPRPRTIARLLDDHAAARAQDPWLTGWPGLLDVRPARGGGQWRLVDEDGDSLPLRGGREWLWPVLAVSGGEVVTVAAELADGRLHPVGVWPRQGYATEPVPAAAAGSAVAS